MLYGAVALVALVSRVRAPRKPRLHVCAQVAEPLLVGDSEQPRLLRTRNLPRSTDPSVSICAAGNLLTRHSWGLSGTSQVLTQDVRIVCTKWGRSMRVTCGVANTEPLRNTKFTFDVSMRDLA